MLRYHRLLALSLFAALPLFAQDTASGPWVMQQSHSTASLRGVHAVGGGVAWASGTGGTILRTEDSGFMWQSCSMPPGAEKLDFRGIWAWDANTAIIMSSGTGDLSRIYKTMDGCSHWKLMYTDPDKDGFFDGIVFQNQTKGFLIGDPVGGKFVFLVTNDGGQTWKRSQSDGLASDAEAKGVFAASNSSLLGGSREPLLFGTGGAFVYEQSFEGKVTSSSPADAPVKMTEQWKRFPLPLAKSGEAAGVFSIGYHGDPSGHGSLIVAVGGDYKMPNETAGTAAWSSDGGQHWTAAVHPPHGFRSAVAWDAVAKAWIAAGTNGSDISYDDGKTWQPLDNGNWNAISLPWIVGPKGRIAKLDEGRLPKSK